MGALPINLTKQSSSPEAIASAVDNAVMVADGFEMWVRSSGPPAWRDEPRPFKGRSVLELGPGETLGASVLLACAGARVSCADRFLAPWDADFHVPFYRALRERLADRGPEYLAPIDRLLAAGRFVPEVVAGYPYAGEELWKVGRKFELVFSNAVLEHVQDIERTAANLATVTADGGWGFHMVDLRDHRDFSRPLEYLTMSREEYETIRHRTHCEGGCQWRKSTVLEAFAAAGFATAASTTMTATPEYQADIRPRLHREFAATSDEDLAAISAFFIVSR